MTPYYDEDGITIYHGDCREILPSLSAEVVLTDPPYGLGDKWVGGGGEFTKTSWRFDPGEARVWDQIVDGVEHLAAWPGAVVIWGGNNYALPASRCWFVWDKKQNDQWTTAQAELAWTNLDRPTRVFRLSQVEAHTGMNKQHPTQKPIELMRWCLSMIRHEGAVLDPFMGSGTTLIAAKEDGRRAIGIEIEEKYCEIAVQRLAQGVLAFD